MYNVLFICTGNAVRSILAEALMTHHAGGRVRAWSAGTNPAGRVHAGVFRLLDRRDIAIEGYRSKSRAEFTGRGAPRMNLIVTLCATARAEATTEWPGTPLATHWDVDDPRAGPSDHFDVALQATAVQIEERIASLLALPFERLDAQRLTPRLDAIA